MRLATYVGTGLILTAPFALTAQEPVAAAWAGSRVALHFGGRYDLSGDRLASPLNYHGWQLPLSLSYDYGGSTAEHEAWLSVGVNTLESRISGALGSTSHVADHVEIGFGYGYARVIARTVRALRLSAGAAFDNVFSLRKYQYGRGLDAETIGEFTSALDLRVVGERTLSSQAGVRIVAEMAPIAFAFRNPYGVGSDAIGDVLISHSYVASYLKLGSVHTVPELMWTRLRAMYEVRSTRHAALRVTYDARYYRFARPRPSAVFETGIDLGLAYAF